MGRTCSVRPRHEVHRCWREGRRLELLLRGASSVRPSWLEALIWGSDFGNGEEGTDERVRMSEQVLEFRFLVIKRSKMATNAEGLWRKCQLCRMTDSFGFLSFWKRRDFGF